MPRERLVSGCDDCPAFWENMEYPETKCMLSKHQNLWGMGHRARGEATPKDCPLLEGPIILKRRK